MNNSPLSLDISDFILDKLNALICVIDTTTYNILYTNNAFKKEFGDVAGKICYHIFQHSTSPCEHCLDPNKSICGNRFQWKNLNGLNKNIHLYNDYIGNWIDGRLVKIHVGINVLDQQLLENSFQSRNEQILEAVKMLVNATIEGLCIFDTNQNCLYANDIALNLFGYSHEEVLNKNVLNFIAPESYGKVIEFVKNKDQTPYEIKAIKKDGSLFPAMVRGKNITLGNYQYRVSAIMDLSDKKEKENEVTRLIKYDLLTSLPNKIYLEDALSKAIQKSQNTQKYSALLCLGIDNFKIINDTKGHTWGDELLIQMTHCLETLLSSSDLMVRFGGDEFAILVETQECDIDRAGNKITQFSELLMNAVKKPFMIENQAMTISISIGIVLFCGSEYTNNTLIRYANSAMHRAKDDGRNTIRFFNIQSQYILEKKAQLCEDVRYALHNNELELYYQKQIYAPHEQSSCVGVEALIRWNHPKRGLLSPLEFIPIAEENGFIHPIGEWILTTACLELKKWEDDPLKSQWKISINISAKQFEKDNFVDTVKIILEKTQCNPKKLCMELTESILIKDTDKSIQKLVILKALGILLSIDDFGTGYSSLQYLKQLPINELKIDKFFIQNILVYEQDKILVDTMINIGNKFGVNVIAEGVETVEQFQLLKTMGCEFFQGYLFAKPVCISQI